MNLSLLGRWQACYSGTIWCELSAVKLMSMLFRDVCRLQTLELTKFNISTELACALADLKHLESLIVYPCMDQEVLYMSQFSCRSIFTSLLPAWLLDLYILSRVKACQHFSRSKGVLTEKLLWFFFFEFSLKPRAGLNIFCFILSLWCMFSFGK